MIVPPRPALVVLALLLLAVPVAAADVGDSCRRSQLLAASKACRTAFGCAPKDLVGASLDTFAEDCLGDAGAPLGKAWGKAVQKAWKKGVSCFTAPTSTGIAAGLSAAASEVAGLVASGFAPGHDEDAAAVAQLAGAVRAAGRYVQQALAAHASHAVTHDDAALAKKLDIAASRFDDALEKVVSASAKKGIALDASSAALVESLEPHLGVIVSGVTESTPYDIGVFVDSPVQGLRFSPALPDGSGETLAGGLFPITAETMTFSVGDIVLGEAPVPATGFVTPVRLVPGAADETHPVVTNIARFLQTIDDDGKPQNGIVITQAVHALAVSASLDLADEAEVVALAEELTAATKKGSHAAVSATSAQEHLAKALLGVLAGQYAGTFSGDDSGTWKVSVSPAGKISGSGKSADPFVGKFSISGQMTSAGSATAVAGNASTGATYSGGVDADGHFSGTWFNSKFNESGTFVGGLVD